MSKILLNEEQRLAVEHVMDYPCAVIAGAGSGKTRVLMARIKYLIENGVSPRKILCCTFTNKAAEEILDRLDFDPKDINVPRVSTIHGLALSAIRKDPKGFGLNDKISPLDEYGQKDLIKSIIERLNLTESVKYWNIVEKISYHRARGLGFSNDYTQEIHEKTLRAHGGYHAFSTDDISVWREYEIEKTKQSLVDFDDMLHLVVNRGLKDVRWAKILSNVYEHVLMDESQDTNTVQWAFINLLLGKDNKNLFVVGDISQSIYGFAGASPEILFNFTKDWRGQVPSLYKLESNHRSVPQVVRLANAIQKHMSDTVPIKMKSYRGDQGENGSIRLMNEMTPKDNAVKIAEQIWQKNQLKVGKVAYKNTAILVRSGSQIDLIEAELVRCRIPYDIKGGKGILKTEEAQDILSYLRLVANPNDVIAMSRSVSIPKRGIGDATIEKIKVIADSKFNGNMIEGAKAYNHLKMGMYVDFLENTLLPLKNKPVEAFNAVLKFTDYAEYIKSHKKYDKDKIEWKLSNIDRIFDIIQNIVTANPDTTVDDIVFQMTMVDRNREDKEDENPDGRVTISTIHSSKGLEWDCIYLFGLVEGSIPHMWSITDKEIEEERRLFYVGITRARDNLVLCSHLTTQRGNSYIATTPSRFLVELGILQSP